MKKTLYYDIIFRECDNMYNDGFIIVDFEDNRKVSFEGILTGDYIKGETENDFFCIKYYELYQILKVFVLKYIIRIPEEDIELPFNCKIISTDETIIDIITTGKIDNEERKQECKNILEKLKRENNVFEEERG